MNPVIRAIGWEIGCFARFVGFGRPKGRPSPTRMSSGEWMICSLGWGVLGGLAAYWLF